MTVIRTGVRRYLILVLTYISLMIIDGKHIFMYLLVIGMSSLNKCLFSFSPLFKLDRGFCFVLLFYYLVVAVLYIFGMPTLYQIYNLQIFPSILYITFSAYWSLLLCKRFWLWHSQSYLFIFAFVSGLKKSSPRSMSKGLSLIFSAMSFMISGIIVKSLVHFELKLPAF